MIRIYYRFCCALIFVLWLGCCSAKPADLTGNTDALNPVQVETAKAAEKSGVREQRSPQFGLLGGDYHDDYGDYDDGLRHLKLGHRRKYNKYHHKPLGLHGGHGCHGYGCGGNPGHGGYYGGPHHGGPSGSFASASAGSLGAGPHGGHSQANAQSASFNFGPYSATFSVAQSSSLRKRF